MRKLFTVAAVAALAASLSACVAPPPNGHRDHDRDGRYEHDRGGRYDNDRDGRYENNQGRWERDREDRPNRPDRRLDGRWDPRN